MEKNNDQAVWVKMPVIRNIVLSAAKNSSDLLQICRSGKIAPHQLDDAEQKVPLETNCALMNASLSISGDACLGLHMGEKVTPAILGMTGHFLQTCKDFLFVLQSMEKFAPTWTRLYQYSVEIKNNEVFYYNEPIQIWNDISPATAMCSVDFSFSGAMSVYRQLTGKNLLIKKVMYRYPPPADTSEHERIFKCRPLFNQSCNCIVFDLADMQAPVMGYNPELNNIFKELLTQELQKNERQENFTAQVRRAILKHYQSVFPQLEEVAQFMNLTPRTLQRKLQDENTSFRLLSDTIKQELANHLLCKENLSISEIAYKLGYAEPGTFSKAFKQWTGKTPGLFRETWQKA